VLIVLLNVLQIIQMAVSYKPVFNRNNQNNKNGLYSIHIRVTIDRKSNYLNPGLKKIGKEFWAGKQNKWVKESHPLSFDINSLLQQKLLALARFEMTLVQNRRAITFDKFKDHFFRKGDGQVFNDYVDDYIKNIKDLAPNTIKVYNSFSTHLDNFNKRIYFHELTEDLVKEFDDFLINKETTVRGAARKKYFDKFKKICKQAKRQGYLDENPFINDPVTIKVEKSKRVYLEVPEIKAIKDLSFNKEDVELEIHRDLFLFQCYSGLYYSDLKELRHEHLEYYNSNLYITNERLKTENTFIIPIYKFPNALRIINKYSERKSEFLFNGLISEQKYNEKLILIAKQAKLEKHITNKVGRHSNVQLWIAMGTERQYVSKMVGHSKEATTQLYYDMSPSNIESRVSHIGTENLDI
jgi:site-specific recombinase XerD